MTNKRIFFLFFKSPHHSWLGSLRWLTVRGKYARKSVDDESIGESPASPEISE